MLNENTKDWQILFVIFSTILLLVSVIWSFNGQWPGSTVEYNSYSIQANAWIHGKVDIKNYTYLELAFYHDKVYVSFPPFPSVIMLPFVLLFDVDTPNAFISLFFAVLGVFYAYKLARNFIDSVNTSLFLAFFISLSTNFVFLMQNGWVWFFAQTLGFCFTMMAFYYATTKKDSDFLWAFLFLALAIGCRPLQFVYGFVLLFFMLSRLKDVKKMFFYMLPGTLVGLLYGWYNTIRFGSFFEFGHNYLPEMVNSVHGLFSLSYFIPNLKKIFLIPPMDSNGIVNYPEFDGFSIFLLNPIIIVLMLLFLFYMYSCFIHYKDKQIEKSFFSVLVIVSMILMHIIFICLHRGLGGWHFGNRYFIDILPAVFLLMCMLDSKLPGLRIIYIPLFIYGFAFNVIGSTLFFLQ